ncbi:ATP-binding protein [uncultured Oxalicibacterium sp.]|uniref:ATP-binding protein n=1 Tax=uncultured Oxalicibacterium sp. TaxID=1168540 RepID=UPI0025EA6981|nr:ATP-binding protein [uncultured Oxalicibacterium sp.]
MITPISFAGGNLPVDLTNCDREPIHIPGSIQPHGALLAFARNGTLLIHSENANDMLGALPNIGAALDFDHLNQPVRDAIAKALTLEEVHDDILDTQLPTGKFDIIFSKSGGLVLVEFEQSRQSAITLDAFAVLAQRAISRIQRQTDTDELLRVAVSEIHALTGFDRVMAYRFLPDDSGEVVAEWRRDDLEPFVGQRYPAGDIPAQARRLYILNPLRLIADIGYRPVALFPQNNPLTHAPLDLSRSVLRSVSPIHVEYLTNMGVAASMSISIVVNDRLWGMIACHHMTPYLVPRAVRMSCQLLSQIVSVLVERTLTQEHARAIQRSAAVRIRITERTSQAGDLLHALSEENPNFLDLIACQGAAASIDGRVTVFGNAPSEAHVLQWINWLDTNVSSDVFLTDSIVRDVPALQDASGNMAGLLAVRFHSERNGYLFWFRNEQIESVRWGGNPDKTYGIGPLGDRLTPRGSFTEWKQEVKNRSHAWLASELEIASQFRTDLQAIALAKSTLSERARDMLFATLGHDLRDPLQAIMMAAEMLERQGATESGKTQSALGKRITNSSGRMKRLISEVLDVSRIQNGLGLSIVRLPTPIAPLLRDLVREVAIAHPHLQILLDIGQAGSADVDADRLSQVVSNLLSNARHHGDNAKPIRVVAKSDEDNLHISIANHGPAIDPQLLPNLFNPFKSSSLQNEKNQGGLGLGLYIVKEIVKGHDGSIAVRCVEGEVIFDIIIPK